MVSYSAMIRYGQDNGRRVHGMTERDLKYAARHMDYDLLKMFNYRMPDMFFSGKLNDTKATTTSTTTTAK